MKLLLEVNSRAALGISAGELGWPALTLAVP
jgi:hypothetical protein